VRAWGKWTTDASRHAVELIPADSRLLRLDNVVLTPPVRWYSADTMRRYLERAVDNCRRLWDGRDSADVVNEYSALPPTA